MKTSWLILYVWIPFTLILLLFDINNYAIILIWFWIILSLYFDSSIFLSHSSKRIRSSPLISSFDLEQGSQLESNYHPAMILKYDTCKSRLLKGCESNSIHSMDNFSLIRLHGMYTGRFQGKQRVLLVGIIASVYGGPFIAG